MKTEDCNIRAEEFEDWNIWALDFENCNIKANKFEDWKIRVVEFTHHPTRTQW